MSLQSQNSSNSTKNTIRAVAIIPQFSSHSIAVGRKVIFDIKYIKKKSFREEKLKSAQREKEKKRKKKT